MSAFIDHGHGLTIVRQAVTSYFSDLRAALSEVVNEAKHLQLDLEDAFNDMETSLLTYLDQAQIDTQIVK